MHTSNMEEEFIYYLTQRGQRMGPYSLRQLQHLRADNMLREDAFAPEEWAALLEVLDGGKRTTRFLDGKRLVEVEPGRGKSRYRPIEYALGGLTWVGYGIGAFFVVWGGLGMEEEFWKSASLWLAVVFAIGLSRVAVSWAVVKWAVEARAKPTFARLMAGFLAGLMPVALLIGISWVASRFTANIAKDRLICYAVICLGAAAVGAVRIPKALLKWRYLAESPEKRFSICWIAVVAIVLAFFFVDAGADRFSRAKAATTYVKYAVFHQQSAESETWRYPIHLGSTRREVEGVFGAASEIANNRYHYSQQGLDVWFDFFNRVSKLGWTASGAVTNGVPIAWGITTGSTLKQLKAGLGEPETGVNDNSRWNHTWSRPPIYIAASGIVSKQEPDGVVKKLEISFWKQEKDQ